MARILITGATGFIGAHLMRALAGSANDVSLALRTQPKAAFPGAPAVHLVGEIGPETRWQPALEGCDTVVHLAAQVPAAAISASRFDTVNDLGTRHLVAEARRSGVERFVYLSTALADAGSAGGSAQGGDSPYARSKHAAEAHVLAFSAPGRVAVVLRPPMVYGAGAKGNWALLERLAATPLPLPFGAIRNRRSVVAVENLVAALMHVIGETQLASRSGSYAVADENPLSIADLLIWLREGMGRPHWLLPMPRGVLEKGIRMLGKARLADSLLGDLVIDATSFQRTFDWTPPLQTADAVRAAGRRYREKSSHPSSGS